MNTDKALNNIIFLPHKLHEGSDSIYSLLMQSGYFELYIQIGEADILRELHKHMECIDQWLELSESKRSSSGWFFKCVDSNNFEVGYFSPSGIYKTVKYLNKIEACAAYIKHEIEDIRLSR